MFVEQLPCVRDLMHPWGAARSVRDAPWHLKARDPGRREKRWAVLPGGTRDCCMRTAEKKVLEAEDLDLEESSSIRSGQKAVQFGWGMGK